MFFPFCARIVVTVLLCSAAIDIQAQTVAIPAGTFTRGSRGGNPSEQPAHRITVSAFSIDAREVTVAEYDACVKKGECTPAHYDDGKCLLWHGAGFKKVVVPERIRAPRFPVLCVSWDQALRYCKFAGKNLPSEAQWEYAALAGTENAYAWGNGRPDSTKCARPAMAGPAPAGSFAPNKWGLFDMTGNVWEWTADRYQQDYYTALEEKDPAGPDVGMYRVIRGGGWYSTAAQLRIKNRYWFYPGDAEASVGFRCVKNTQ